MGVLSTICKVCVIQWYTLCEVPQTSSRSPWAYLYDPRSGGHYSTWRWVGVLRKLHLTPGLLDSETTTPLLHPLRIPITWCWENQVIWFWPKLYTKLTNPRLTEKAKVEIRKIRGNTFSSSQSPVSHISTITCITYFLVFCIVSLVGGSLSEWIVLLMWSSDLLVRRTTSSFKISWLPPVSWPPGVNRIGQWKLLTTNTQTRVTVITIPESTLSELLDRGPSTPGWRKVVNGLNRR